MDTERTSVSRESRRLHSAQEQRSPWGKPVCGEISGDGTRTSHSVSSAALVS